MIPKTIRKRLQKNFSKKKNRSNVHMFLIAIGVIMIWRGIRGVLDKFLFPNNELISYIVGAIIGIIIIYIDDKRIDELGHH